MTRGMATAGTAYAALGISPETSPKVMQSCGFLFAVIHVAPALQRRTEIVGTIKAKECALDMNYRRCGAWRRAAGPLREIKKFSENAG
jgi:hypothetical protein